MYSHITSYGGTWDDIRAPIVTIPISQLNPRLNKNLMQLKPLVACLAMESLVQLWMVSVETIAAPITGTHAQKCSRYSDSHEIYCPTEHEIYCPTDSDREGFWV